MAARISPGVHSRAPFHARLRPQQVRRLHRDPSEYQEVVDRLLRLQNTRRRRGSSRPHHPETMPARTWGSSRWAAATRPYARPSICSRRAAYMPTICASAGSRSGTPSRSFSRATSRVSWWNRIATRNSARCCCSRPRCPRTACARCWPTAGFRSAPSTWSSRSPVQNGAVVARSHPPRRHVPHRCVRYLGVIIHAIHSQAHRRPPQPASQCHRAESARLRRRHVHAVRCRLRPRSPSPRPSRCAGSCLSNRI